MSERSAFRASILAADDMQRLLKRLTLVERFHAVMVTCEMPRVANELVDILRTDVSERRGVEMLVVRLDPYAKRENALEPMSERWLLDEVLEKLVFPPPEHQGASVLTIVDASNAMPADDDAWSLLFQRMNERRNAIMQAIAGPFLVVGPKRYVALVGRSAPDVWSIVGAIVDVPTPAMDEQWEEVVGGDESGLDVTTFLEVLSLAFIHEPKDLDIATAKLEVANARRLFEQVPNLGLFRVSLAMQLTQMASLLLSQPDSQAIELLDESLELLQPYVDFEQPPFIFALFAYAHIFRGMARWVRKEFARAAKDLEEGLLWIQRDDQAENISIEGNALVATAMGTLGILHRRLGHLDEAVEYFTNCISHDEDLLAATNAVDIEQQIAFVHDELGRIFCAKHDWDQAWAYFDQAATLHHQLWQRSPGDADALSSFASTRFAMIKLQGLRGDERRARALANAVLEALEQYPNVSAPEPHLVDLAAKIRTYVARWH